MNCISIKWIYELFYKRRPIHGGSGRRAVAVSSLSAAITVSSQWLPPASRVAAVSLAVQSNTSASRPSLSLAPSRRLPTEQNRQQVSPLSLSLSSPRSLPVYFGDWGEVPPGLFGFLPACVLPDFCVTLWLGVLLWLWLWLIDCCDGGEVVCSAGGVVLGRRTRDYSAPCSGKVKVTHREKQNVSCRLSCFALFCPPCFLMVVMMIVLMMIAMIPVQCSLLAQLNDRCALEWQRLAYYFTREIT